MGIRTNTREWPECVDNETMQRKFVGGPVVKSAVLVLVSVGSPDGGRLYKREGNTWWLLDDKPKHPMPGGVEHGP
jgi:hypothetical protein